MSQPSQPANAIIHLDLYPEKGEVVLDGEGSASSLSPTSSSRRLMQADHQQQHHSQRNNVVSTTKVIVPVVAPSSKRSLCSNNRQLDLCELLLNHHHDQHDHSDGDDDDDDAAPKEWEKYRTKHPLVYSMLHGEQIRTEQLQQEGEKQIFYPKSNDGWLRTLFVVEGRALDWVFGVWLFVNAHAVLYTLLHELVDDFQERRTKELSTWETAFGIALNATLGFLLVFRLQRAAARWWLARQLFGNTVAKIRALTSGLLVHGSHDPENRDHAIRWMVAYCISVAEFLRGCRALSEKLFEGILSKKEVAKLQNNTHPPLFAAEQGRYYLKRVFCVTSDTPLALATAWSQQLIKIEEEWTAMLDNCGGMERVKATPLPIVYVSHLRTFLVLTLLLYPYVWGHEWGWGTIPIVAMTSFSLLGIEAASVEVEMPFTKNRVNALNMSGFCIGILSNVQQMIRQHADRELFMEEPSGENGLLPPV